MGAAWSESDERPPVKVRIVETYTVVEYDKENPLANFKTMQKIV